MKKVLIIDEMHESICPLIEGIGYLPVYSPKITREEILQEIGEYEGLIIRSKTIIDEELLNKAVHLKFIGRAGAGLDQIDVTAVESRNISIFNAPEGNRDALGEHTVGLLLALTNKIVIADKEVRTFSWNREKNRGFEIGELTIGLFGYGNMAKAFAKRLKGFGCKIFAYDKYKTGFSDEYVKEATLEELQKIADVFSLHTPLTNETKGLINQRFLEKFNKNIWLVNTSRGEIVPTKDVLTLLESGKLKGAALDVLENEKMNGLTIKEHQIYKALFERNNVVLSPHVAGWSFESYKKINEVLIQKIKE